MSVFRWIQLAFFTWKINAQTTWFISPYDFWISAGGLFPKHFQWFLYWVYGRTGHAGPLSLNETVWQWWIGDWKQCVISGLAHFMASVRLPRDFHFPNYRYLATLGQSCCLIGPEVCLKNGFSEMVLGVKKKKKMGWVVHSRDNLESVDVFL